MGQTLYKFANDKILTWRTWTEGNVIHTERGYEGGAVQNDTYTVHEGTNIGKVNERNPEQQAEFVADARWKKQIQYKGYFTSREEAIEKKDSTNMHFGGRKPMKAKKHEDMISKWKFPCYVQPKLDGIRCDCKKIDGEVKLFLSGGQEIVSMPHVALAANEFLKDDEELDGEIYLHGTPLKEISGATRKKKNIDFEEHLKYEYHVFEPIRIYDLNGYTDKQGELLTEDDTFEDRHKVLSNELTLDRVFIDGKKVLHTLPTKLVNSEEEATEFYNEMIGLGYEGIMYRKIDMVYKSGKRSADIIKRKDFQDAEYKIVDIVEGNGKLTGCVAAFICETEEGKQFHAPMNGTHEYLKELMDNPSMWENQVLTVRFLQCWDGVPQIPKGIHIRPEGE